MQSHRKYRAIAAPAVIEVLIAAVSSIVGL